MYTTVFFDMDGLIFDSERLYLKMWALASEITGIPMSETLLFRRIPGSSSKTIGAYFQEEYGDQWEENLNRLREVRKPFIEQALQSPLPTKKGLFELLSYLKENHYRIGMATSSTRETALRQITSSGLAEYFDHMIFGTDIEKHKPDPEIYLKLMEKFQVTPEECLVLEDSLHGIQAGTAAGCHVVFVPDLIQNFEQEEQFYRFKVSSLDEVIPILQAEV